MLQGDPEADRVQGCVGWDKGCVRQGGEHVEDLLEVPERQQEPDVRESLDMPKLWRQARPGPERSPEHNVPVP